MDKIIREIHGYNVIQRVRDGYFDARMILRQFSENENLLNEFTDEHENIIKEIKKPLINSSYLDENDVRHKRTYMHPYLFSVFIVWLDPSLKLESINIAQKELIEFRKETAKVYKQMSSSISRISAYQHRQKNIIQVARAINHIVFGKHETGSRNSYANMDNMRELWALQSRVSNVINDGFIGNYFDLMDYLRKIYKEKHR